jgi:hypothetical protein
MNRVPVSIQWVGYQATKPRASCPTMPGERILLVLGTNSSTCELGRLMQHGLYLLVGNVGTLLCSWYP